MKFFKQLFDFYINSSIHVALAVFSLVEITMLYLSLTSNRILSLTIFFASIVGYNFIKDANLKKFKPIHLVSIISFVLMIFFGCQLQIKTLVFFIPFAVLTFLYKVSILKSVGNFRSIPKLKIVFIAFVWAGVTVLFPVVNSNYPLSLNVILMFVHHFLLIVVLVLPFDIRDFQIDEKKLETIPQLIGEKRTKKVGFLVLSITLVIEFFIAPNSTYKNVYIIVFLLLLVLLQRATKQQGKYYSSFWVESIPIFWFILLETQI